jgi:hypothetical protein
VVLINGSMISCVTFANRRITTSPPRSIMPPIGGFSCTKVSRPRAPSTRQRRSYRPRARTLARQLVCPAPTETASYSTAPLTRAGFLAQYADS